MPRLITCAVLVMALTSCAMRVPEPAGLPPGVPHVSWIIMYGDRDNPDAEFACQSTGPRECVIPASRPESRTFSDVHLYLHGAGRETTYVGNYRIEFLGDGDHVAHDSPLNETVRGDEEIANHSITGIVITKPGTYALRVVLEATTAAGSTPIREEISVQVR